MVRSLFVFVVKITIFYQNFKFRFQQFFFRAPGRAIRFSPCTAGGVPVGGAGASSVSLRPPTGSSAATAGGCRSYPWRKYDKLMSLWRKKKVSRFGFDGGKTGKAVNKQRYI